MGIGESQLWEDLCFYQCVVMIDAYNDRYYDQKTLVAWQIANFAATQGVRVSVDEILSPRERDPFDEFEGEV